MYFQKKPSELSSRVALPLVSEVSVATCAKVFVLAVMLWALVQQVCSRAATHYRTIAAVAVAGQKAENSIKRSNERSLLYWNLTKTNQSAGMNQQLTDVFSGREQYLDWPWFPSCSSHRGTWRGHIVFLYQWTCYVLVSPSCWVPGNSRQQQEEWIQKSRFFNLLCNRMNSNKCLNPWTVCVMGIMHMVYFKFTWNQQHRLISNKTYTKSIISHKNSQLSVWDKPVTPAFGR